MDDEDLNLYEAPSDDAKKQRDLELLTIRNTMKSEAGRRMFFRMLFSTGVYNLAFNPDPYMNAYNSGLRQHGIWLIEELKQASLDYYLKMLKENS